MTVGGGHGSVPAQASPPHQAGAGAEIARRGPGPVSFLAAFDRGPVVVGVGGVVPAGAESRRAADLEGGIALAARSACSCRAAARSAWRSADPGPVRRQSAVAATARPSGMTYAATRSVPPSPRYWVTPVRKNTVAAVPDEAEQRQRRPEQFRPGTHGVGERNQPEPAADEVGDGADRVHERVAVGREEADEQHADRGDGQQDRRDLAGGPEQDGPQQHRTGQDQHRLQG